MVPELEERSDRAPAFRVWFFSVFFSDFAFLQAPARSAGAKKIKPGGARGGRRGGNPAGKAMSFFHFFDKKRPEASGPGPARDTFGASGAMVGTPEPK